MAAHRGRSGQTLMEYTIASVGVLLPVTFMIVYTAQILWTWHSVVEWTRDGARYAATHCWQASPQNVISYMQTNVPPNLEQDQFAFGTTTINVNYFLRDPASGNLTDFTCDGGDCSTDCIPDAVTVSLTGYQYGKFVTYLKLPPIALPNFVTTLPIESAGCDGVQASCNP